MTIRWMKLEDLDGVMCIEKAAFQTPWQRSSFENELLMNNLACYLVCEIEGVIAGYIGCWHVVDEGHITNVAVHPAFRRRGIAKALIEALIDFAHTRQIEALTLEVRISNFEAIKLYEGFGFISHGIRPKYYQDTQEDALIMWASIKKETP